MASSKQLGADTLGNYLRALCSIFQIHSDILRKDLEAKVKPNEIEKFLRKYKIKIKEDLITDAVSRKSYSEFDITTLYTIFRNGNTTKPRKGWNTPPDATDVFFEDDLERIRLMRNELVHLTKLELSDADFNDIWKKMEDICYRADARIPGSVYTQELRTLKMSSLDKATEERLKFLKKEGIKDPLDIAIEKTGNIVQEWEEFEIYYFPTKAAKEIQSQLQNRAVVTVVGRSGTGKTYTCQQIAVQYKRRGWMPFPVSDIEELVNLLNPRSIHRQIYILDDPLGKECIDSILSDKFKRYGKCLQRYLEHSQNIKLMITSRYLIKHDSMNLNNIVIDDSLLGLSIDEKLGIISKYQSIWSLDEKDRIELLRVEDYFPLLCSMFENDPKNRRDGLDFFKNPRHRLENEIGILKSDYPEKYCALLLLAVSGGRLSKGFFSSNRDQDKSLFFNISEILRLSNDSCRESVMKQLNSLLGNFIVMEEDTYKFRHDFILETFTLKFGRDFPNDMLKLCSIEFICHNVILKGSNSERNPETVLQISDNLIENLMERIFVEFRKGNCHQICLSNLLRNENLISAICTRIKELSTVEFHSILLTTHNNYSSSSSSLKDVPESVLQNVSALRDLFEIMLTEVENNLASEKIQDFFSQLGIEPESSIRQFINGCKYSLCHFWYSKNKRGKSFDQILNRLSNSEEHGSTVLDVTLSTLCKGNITELHKQNIVFFFTKLNQLLNGVFESEFKCLLTSVCNQMLLSDNSFIKTDLYDFARWYIFSMPNFLQMSKEYQIPNRKKMELFELRKSLKSQFTIFAPKIAVSSCLALTGHKQIFDCILKRINDENLLQSCNDLKLVICSCAVGSFEFLKTCFKEFDPNMLDENWNYQMNYLKLGHCAAVFQQPQVMKLLFQYGVNVNERDIYENSALHLGIESCITDSKCVMRTMDRLKETVHVLLEHKANVNLKNFNRITPVHLAAQVSNHHVLKLILQYDGKVDVKDNCDLTPLHYACKRGFVANVECLLKSGQNTFLNDRTLSGETSLFIASKFGHEMVVLKLLEHNADVDICDLEGKTPLLIAVANGHRAVVANLIKYKADVNIADNRGTTPLMYASYFGDLGIAKYLIKNNANLYASSRNKWNSLLFASLNHNESMVELLLKKRVNVDIKGHNGNTPLILASKKGFSKITEILLEHKADVNAVNDDNDTALTVASNEGHLKIVQQLLCQLQQSSDFIYLLNEKHTLSLFQAAANGHISVVEELIGSNANIDRSTGNGETPLIIATYNQHYEVVDILLRNGADVHLFQRDGMTALHFAVKNGNEAIVKLLMERKANVNRCDIYGNSSLHLAAQYGRLNILKCLMKNKEDLKLHNKDGRNILHIACFYKQEDIVSYLVKNKCYSDAEDAYGLTAISLAVSSGHINIVKELLRYVDDVDIQDRSKETFLMKATDCGHFEVVKLLLEAMADVDMQQSEGNSSLMIAARWGSEKITRELLKFGADVNKRNIIGATALMVASYHGHKDIVELLCEKGATINDKTYDIGRSTLFLDHGTNITDIDINGLSPLMMASYHNHFYVVELLLDRNADVNLQGIKGKTALHLALEKEFYEIVDLLLQRKPDQDVYTDDGLSAFHIAVKHGSLYFTISFLENGVDMHKPTKSGDTALHIAAMSGHENIVYFLLINNFSVFMLNKKKESALYSAAIQGRTDIVLMILTHIWNLLIRQKVMDNIFCSSDDERIFKGNEKILY